MTLIDDVAADASLPALFDRVAAGHPHRIAVDGGSGDQLTYAQLRSESDALAVCLAGQGVARGHLVGLVTDRTSRAVVRLLAVLKAGAAYVPLDPAYPAERLRFIAEDAGLRAVAGDAATVRSWGIAGLTAVEESAGDCRDAPAGAGPDDAAYVIYTSGSTGLPKGCVVTHRNVLALMNHALPLFDVSSADRWSVFHSLSFDFSVWEVWGAFATGATAVVVPGPVALSPPDFLTFLAERRITVLSQVPSVFRAVQGAAAAAPPGRLDLRYVVFGGESVDLRAAGAFAGALADPPVLVNMYGITETTVHATYKVLAPEDLRDTSRSPIGVPLPHLGIHLLDERGEPVPDGETGEIWVTGAGVAAGYLNRPELTAERFQSWATPHGPVPAYRSGDLARRLPGGELEYAGRNDDQVKLRGFRIELGEVEAALRHDKSVQDAAVTVVTTELGAQFLVACLVGAAGQIADRGAAVRERMLAELPRHLVPDRYVSVDALPLTASGKLDRRAVRELATARRTRGGA